MAPTDNSARYEDDEAESDQEAAHREPSGLAISSNSETLLAVSEPRSSGGAEVIFFLWILLCKPRWKGMQFRPWKAVRISRRNKKTFRTS